MKKAYEKNELWFAITWIIIYVVVMGNLRGNLGDDSPFTALALFIIAAVLTIFIVKNELAKKYGFTGVPDAKRYLYYIPFVLLCSVNFWFGVSMHYEMPYQIFAIVSMALVGYVEEIVFRGFLFRAIEKDSETQAIIITAVTFGAGHIVNLLTGHAGLETWLQIAYAIAIGFAFAMFFYKSGSLIPCIITHSAIDVASRFSGESSQTQDIIAAVFLIIVAGGYALYLHWKVEKTEI